MEEKSYTRIIDYVKSQIMSGEIRIGDKLPAERELSDSLGVSRNSVREALRTLDIMGVISSQHGAGNYLTGDFEKNLMETMSMMFIMNQIYYEQISQLRLGLEIQAMMLAIDNITEHQIEQLESILTKLEQGTEENNVVLDKQFHYTITLASKNLLIIDILQAVADVMDHFIVDLRKEILDTKESKQKLQEAHGLMLKSLKNKDKELGREALYKHFSVIDEKLSKITNNNIKNLL
ncbi:MAG: regulatory protein GntR [Anaerocolumna sp.]|jgi:GntR family transcriptional repressor for pyruvate dehydrogenase complex|nr:regulatory protein GntR [Anaerocolumna sp.]